MESHGGFKGYPRAEGGSEGVEQHVAKVGVADAEDELGAFDGQAEKAADDCGPAHCAAHGPHLFCPAPLGDPKNPKEHAEGDKERKVAEGVKQRIEEVVHAEEVVEGDQFDGPDAMRAGFPESAYAQHGFEQCEGKYCHDVDDQARRDEATAWKGGQVHRRLSYPRLVGLAWPRYGQRGV